MNGAVAAATAPRASPPMIAPGHHQPQQQPPPRKCPCPRQASLGTAVPSNRANTASSTIAFFIGYLTSRRAAARPSRESITRSELAQGGKQLGRDQLDHAESLGLCHVGPEEAQREMGEAQLVEPRELVEALVRAADDERVVHEAVDAAARERGGDGGQAVLGVTAVFGLDRGSRLRPRPLTGRRDVELTVHGNL